MNESIRFRDGYEKENHAIAVACGWEASRDFNHQVCYPKLRGQKPDIPSEFSHDLMEDLYFDPSESWEDFFIAFRELGLTKFTLGKIGGLWKANVLTGTTQVSSRLHDTPIGAAQNALYNYVVSAPDYYQAREVVG